MLWQVLTVPTCGHLCRSQAGARGSVDAQESTDQQRIVVPWAWVSSGGSFRILAALEVYADVQVEALAAIGVKGICGLDNQRMLAWRVGSYRSSLPGP